MTNDTPHLPLPSRRRFLQQAGMGFGSLALAALLHQDGVLAANDPQPAGRRPPVRGPHFPPRVRSVIWLFMTGGPSQVDTFDYKPELQRRDGQPLAGAD